MQRRLHAWGSALRGPMREPANRCIDDYVFRSQDALPMSVSSPAERDELNQLLQRAGRGDQQAFAELYRRTSSKLFGICLRMLRDRGEAEEVLQETYTTVWRRAASFDAAKASAITWLVTLSRNKAIDRLRQHREELMDDPARLDETVDEQPTPAADAETSQEYQRLQHCLDQLEPQQQSSVREAFFTGATYNELAMRCKVPLGTMKSWIRRSLMQLRTCLDQ
ncbi:sigma-70 family RNA polymerase sigma factor [Rhodanobacter umsongensis]|uniref:Sigma-70 family RNA polymerase sigma factor n=1 Tax=Rhodanobacter umsongensis TaxID=633153 RepID=A0ABW0JIJ0_9GAMM